GSFLPPADFFAAVFLAPVFAPVLAVSGAALAGPGVAVLLVFFLMGAWYTRTLDVLRGKSTHCSRDVDNPLRTPENARPAPAQVAELVDALASGASGGNSVEVRVLF